MCPIQVRPEINALTVPLSYKLTYVSSGSIGTQGLAAEMAAENPNYNAEEIQMMLQTLENVIRKNLLAGKQVTLNSVFTIGLSFTGKLDKPDDPLPPVENTLQVNIHILSPFLKGLRQQAELVRLPMNEKVPNINAAEDTTLGLNNVLLASGALHLTGSNLSFNQSRADEGCTITGTRSGSQKQSRFVTVSNSEVTFLPDIPAQDDSWNNEYLLSISTRYTKNGNLRSSSYRNRLRTPITLSGFALPIPPEAGILTGNAAAPYVSVTGGMVNADTQLRIQAVQDLAEERLWLNLLDMQEDGAAGQEVEVTQNQTYTLPGFAGSLVSSLEVRVNAYAELWEMLRRDYNGRLVDILDVRM